MQPPLEAVPFPRFLSKCADAATKRAGRRQSHLFERRAEVPQSRGVENVGRALHACKSPAPSAQRRLQSKERITPYGNHKIGAI